jgi:hypothetical protein
MCNKKDAMMFANQKQLLQTNRILKAGIYMALTGITLLAIGGRSFYNKVSAIKCDDSTSDVINDIFEDLRKHKG